MTKSRNWTVRYALSNGVYSPEILSSFSHPKLSHDTMITFHQFFTILLSWSIVKNLFVEWCTGTILQYTNTTGANQTQTL